MYEKENRKEECKEKKKVKKKKIDLKSIIYFFYINF